MIAIHKEAQYEIERSNIAKLMRETGYREKFCCRIQLIASLEKLEIAVTDLRTAEPQRRSKLRAIVRELRARIVWLSDYQRTLYACEK